MPQQTQSQDSDADVESNEDDFEEAILAASSRSQAGRRPAAGADSDEGGTHWKREIEWQKEAGLSGSETVDVSHRNPASQVRATCSPKANAPMRSKRSTLNREEAYNAALSGRWDEEVHLRSTTPRRYPS